MILMKFNTYTANRGTNLIICFKAKTLARFTVARRMGLNSQPTDLFVRIEHLGRWMCQLCTYAIMQARFSFAGYSLAEWQFQPGKLKSNGFQLDTAYY